MLEFYIILLTIHKVNDIVHIGVFRKKLLYNDMHRAVQRVILDHNIKKIHITIICAVYDTDTPEALSQFENWIFLLVFFCLWCIHRCVAKAYLYFCFGTCCSNMNFHPHLYCIVQSLKLFHDTSAAYISISRFIWLDKFYHYRRQHKGLQCFAA